LHLCFNFEPESLRDFMMVCRKSTLYGTHSYFVLPFNVSSCAAYIDPYVEEPVGRRYSVDSQFANLLEASAAYRDYITLLPESVVTPHPTNWDTATMLNAKLHNTFLKRQLLERDSRRRNHFGVSARARF